MTEFVIRHDGWTSEYETWAEMNDAMQSIKYLEMHDFKVLGYAAGEFFFMSGAWKETEHMVFCLVDADPFTDKRGKVIFPDPFSFPDKTTHMCGLLIYRKPFVKGPDNEDWKMDGTAPVNVNTDNVEFARMMFPRLVEAIEFCDFIRHMPPIWQKEV